MALYISGCGINHYSPKATPDLPALPLESESSAPPLETSVEEIMIGRSTPTGLCVKDEANDFLNCFDKEGKLLITLPVPGIGRSDPGGLHISGSLKSGAANPPVVYYSWEPEQVLLTSDSKQTLPLRNTNAFLALAGSIGQPVVAFSEVTYDGNSPHSYLFAGTLETLGNAAAFFDFYDNLTGMALMPIAVEASGKQALKVWFTHTAWGIGGADIIFPINRGLFVFDLTTGQNKQALGTDRNFQGLSPNNAQTGSISFDLEGDHSMHVTDLATGQMVNFPLNPLSDRGAGYAVFSIDGKYTAWLEASGSMIEEPSNFQPRIRVAEITAGAAIHEVDAAMAAKVLSWKQVFFMKPVGWLDSQTLVIEARMSDWNTASLIKYDIDSGSLAFLCQGSFAGFTYP